MRPSNLWAGIFVLMSLVVQPQAVYADTLIKLAATTSPPAAQPGVHLVSVYGTNVPTGTVSPSALNIRLESTSGGNVVSTVAKAVTTVSGTTRNISFIIPSTITVSSPTSYTVFISGTTTTGVAFSSSNKAALIINPPAAIKNLVPSSVSPGKAAAVTITTTYTNFVQGATVASFGPGIAVGGAAEGAFGPVTVSSPTTATAQIVVNAGAGEGFRTVTAKTGVQQAALANQFSVTATAPANNPPAISSPPAGLVNEGLSAKFTFSCSDPDGDPVALTAADLPSFANFTAIGGSGELTVSPGFTHAGVYPIKLNASDGKGGTITKSWTFTVQNVNRSPLLDPVGDKIIAENELLTFTLTGSDPDADPLVFSAQGVPAGAAFDPATRVFSWRPTYGNAGSYTVSFFLSDGTAPVERKTQITVTDVNRPPTIETPTLPGAVIDQEYRQSVTASDPDGDPLTFSLEAAPPGMTINAVSGQLSWTPQEVAVHQLTVKVVDGKGGEARKAFTVAIPDTIPPSVSVNAPKEAIPGSTFTVTAEAADNVAVVLVKLTVDGQGTVDVAAPPYKREVTLPAVAAVGSTVAVTAEAFDAAGNSKSASTSVTIAAIPDTTPPTVALNAPAVTSPGTEVRLVADASDDQGIAGLTFFLAGVEIGRADLLNPTVQYHVPADAAAGVHLDFSVEAIDFSGNKGNASRQTTVSDTADVTAPVVELQAPESVETGTTISAVTSATDAGGVALLEVFVNRTRTHSFTSGTQRNLTLAFPSGAKAGDDIIVEARAVDFAGNAATAEKRVKVVEPTIRQGVISGAVFDDTTGLPLPEATIILTAAGKPPVETLTDSRGRYFFVAEQGEYGIVATKAGFTAVDRPQVTVAANVGRRVFDARLTPLGSSAAVSAILGGAIRQPLDAKRASLASAALEAESSVSGEAIITIPGGAVAAETPFTLTATGVQSIQGLLPAGWSPVGAVDVAPHGVIFADPAQVAIPNLLELEPATIVVAARWDEAQRVWVSAGRAAISEDGAKISAAAPVSAHYAFLVADVGHPAPEPAAGSFLLGVAQPVLPDAQSVVVPNPKIMIYKPGVKSLVGVSAAPAAAAASGVRIRASLAEDYRFYNGSAANPEPYAEDIVLYGYNLAAGKLVADFMVSPAPDAAAAPLEKGIITVTASVPGEEDGAIVGPPGGTVAGPAGEAAAIPAGAVTTFIPVALRPVPEAELPVLPVGVELLGAVRLTAPGGFAFPATLSLPLPAGFTAGGDVFLTRVVEVLASTRLELVARGETTGGRLTSSINIPGSTVTLPGVVTEGRFLFIRVPLKAGFVGGLVSGTEGKPFAGAVATVDTLPFVSFSRASGAYVAAAAPGAFMVTAVDQVKNDAGSAAGTVVADAFTAADVTLKAEPPRVVSVLPAAGAKNVALADSIRLRFSEPVAPATVSHSSIYLSAEGSTVPGSLTVEAGAMEVVIRPLEPLVPNRVYTVTATVGVTDRAGYPLSPLFTSTFTSLDTLPPTPPPAGTVTASIPNAEGKTIITGTKGTAGLHDTVFILNLRTGQMTPVQIDPDGGFTAMVDAKVNDRLELVIRDEAGNESKVALPRFTQKNADGSISSVMGAEGGRIVVGNLNVDVPANAFPAGAVVKIKALTEAELGIPAPAEYPFVSGLEVESTVAPKVYLNVSAPMPPGTDPRTNGVVVQVIDAYGSPAFGLVDTAKMIGGRLATSSPPCPGIVDRVGRYALLLNDDQEMRYETALARIQPPKSATTNLIVETFFAAVGSFLMPEAQFKLKVDVDSPYNTLCMPLPPNQQGTFVFRDAHTGEVVQSIPVTTTTVAGTTINVSYVDNSDTKPPKVVETRPFNKTLSLATRTIQLRFDEPIVAAGIEEAIKLLDTSNSDAEMPIEIRISENNTLATITPKQLLSMGKRYRLSLSGVKDFADNPSVPPSIDFSTYAPKLVFPTATDVLDWTALGSPDISVTRTAALSDLDFHTTPPQTSTDGKWHTNIFGSTMGWGFGAGYRALAFDASDPTKPKVLAGFQVQSKYTQKVQYLKDIALVPRETPGTATWRQRELYHLKDDPTVRICADPTTDEGQLALEAWKTKNTCSAATDKCTKVTGGCGDLALVSGYDPVYSHLWIYDITKFSSPVWYFGARLLSDNGAERGYPRRKYTPAGFGMARRFSVLSPVDITHGTQTHSGALGAYIPVLGIGLELVDIGLSIPDISDFERVVPGAPLLTVAERIGLNSGGMYYQDVQIVKGKVVAIAGDRSDGTGIKALEIFGTDLSGPTGMISLSHIPNKMTVREDFVKYDADGDETAESHDVAIVTGYDGGLSVVEIPADSATAPQLLAFLKTPANSYTQHVEIDPLNKVAYIGARWTEGSVATNGLLVADLSRLGAEAGATVDAAGWDSRFVGKIPITTPASGNVNIKGFRIDRQRGLLYAGVDGGGNGDSFVVIKISDCADLQVDFVEETPRVPIPVAIEKKALQKVFADGITKAGIDCSSSAIVGMKVLEQGSGACVWKGTCKGNYQPGISDHDFEIFFPKEVDADKRACVIKRLYAQVRDDVNDEPKKIEIEGYNLAFEDISFFPMTREEFEAGKLNVTPPETTEGDVTGDMGLGRQMLLLKWLLEGAYVEVADFDLKGKPLAEILALLRSPIIAVPPNPALNEPSRVKRLEGYEWAKLQEAEVYASGALIRFHEEAKPGTTLAHVLEKQLHKVGKAGIRAVLAKMIAHKDGNDFTLGNAMGNVHDNMTCINNQDSETSTDWKPEQCDSFEHWVASVAARTVRDTTFNLFTAADIKNLVYPLYRTKAGKLHFDDDVKVNEFLGRAFTFITELGKDGGPAKTVYSATLANDADSAQRGTNLDSVLTRITTAKTEGKKQIVPRILNKGGRLAKDILLHMHVPAETTKETVALEPTEGRHMDTKKIPDPDDGTKKKTVKVFSLTGINQSSTSSGNKWASFLFDLPEKRAEEPERKNNWAKLYYYVLDPANPSIPTPGDPVLPITETDPPTLFTPDDVCIDRSPGLKIEQLIDGVRVEATTLYIGGGCKDIDIVVTNISTQTMKNLKIQSSLTGATYTPDVNPFAPGATYTFTINRCPATTVKTEVSSLFPTAETASGHNLPMAVTADVVSLETRCPVAILPPDPDPNPEVSEIGFGGTAYRYYTVTKVSEESLAPVVGAEVKVEFLTDSGLIQKTYTTDDNGSIVLPGDSSVSTDEKGLAMPWDMWALTTISSAYTDNVQATIRVSDTACVVPVKFSVSRKPFEFEESIKAGAALKVSGSIFGRLSLGAGGSLTLSTKRSYDGATTTQDNFSVSRSASGSIGLAFKPELDFKIKAGGKVGVAGPGLGAGLKLGGVIGDKYEFTLPLTDVQKKQTAGLILDTVAASQTLSNPILYFISHYLVDSATGFTAARTARSVGLSGEGELSLNLAVALLVPKIIRDNDSPNLNIGFSGSGKMGLSFGGEYDEKEKKFGTSMEATGELAWTAGLTSGKLQEEQAAAGSSNVIKGVRTVFKKAEDLLSSASGGGAYSGGAKIALTTNTNFLPEKISFSISTSKNYGLRSIGESIEDLGVGDKKTFTLTVEGFDQVKPLLVSMVDMSSLVVGETTKLKLGIPTQNPFISASSLYEKYMKFGRLMLDNASYSEDVEGGGSVTIPIGIKAVAGAGFELGINLSGEHTSGYTLRSGVVRKGQFFKLKEYPPGATAPLEVSLPNLYNDIWAKVSDSVSGYFHSIIKTKEPAINHFQVKSLGSAELNLQSEADYDVVSNLRAYSFNPIAGPVKPLLYSPQDVTGVAGKPHYGIGGFQSFTPESARLAAPGTLIINYHDPEVEGLDETSLAIYRWNDTRSDWDIIPGVHDLTANTITTQISTLGLYTVAPAMPAGTVSWTVAGVERVGLERDAKTYVNLTAGPFTRNNGTPVPENTEFHLYSVSPYDSADAFEAYGTIITPDANPDVEGVQHRIGSDGLLHARLEMPGNPQAVRLLTFSAVGTTYGEAVVPLDTP